jgi:hypothetical protein
LKRGVLSCFRDLLFPALGLASYKEPCSKS